MVNNIRDNNILGKTFEEKKYYLKEVKEFKIKDLDKILKFVDQNEFLKIIKNNLELKF